MIYNLFNFCPQSAQPVATGGLAPRTKLEEPRIET